MVMEWSTLLIAADATFTTKQVVFDDIILQSSIYVQIPDLVSHGPPNFGGSLESATGWQENVSPRPALVAPP